jgi:hypothetical protein
MTVAGLAIGQHEKTRTETEEFAIEHYVLLSQKKLKNGKHSKRHYTPASTGGEERSRLVRSNGRRTEVEPATDIETRAIPAWLLSECPTESFFHLLLLLHDPLQTPRASAKN